MFKLANPFIILSVFIMSFSSCIEKIDKPITNKHSAIPNNKNTVTTIKDLDRKKDYFLELGRMLRIQKSDLDKIRKIIIDHRKNRKGLEGNELDIEVNKRESLLSDILSKSKMAQKSFIDFKYFGAKIKDPFHPINIQIKYSLNDDQMLKFITVCQLYNKRELRIAKLNGVIENDILEQIFIK